YNIIVLDGSTFGAPSLVVAPSTIAQTLESAPDAGTSSLIVGDPAPPAEPAQAETEAPVATEAPAQQVVAPAEDVIIGEITALDPSANLNIRQFPDAQAFNLGQAPAGAALTIIGREGAPVALVEGDPPPPEADTFVDPVLDLGEGQDLDPTQTWVRVIYDTPDGGQIEGWVLSQFLTIRDDKGLIDLRDLETAPGNVPGETRNTDVTPPPPPEDIVTAEVINLNIDAGLNIRRAPDANSEVLSQITVGTVVELEGLLVSSTGFLEDSEWAFITYSPAEGGVITGWVSTNFLQYFLNGDLTDITELVAEGLIDETLEDETGEVNANAAPVTASTPDPQVDAYVAEVILNEGANLNLRRDPSVQAEVLQGIPAGTFLIVTARTADSEWLQTSYEGDTGWITSQVVSVTFNGEFVSDLSEIPVDSTIGTSSDVAPETTETP
ncbi:MAG: SH3 domain-containing protein, partial [Chloroflexota bacterium]